MRFCLRWAVVVFAALLLSVAGFYRWPLSSAFVTRQIGARVSTAGFALRGPGSVTLSILPTPTLHVIDAEWDSPTGAPAITAPRASIRLGFLPLLAGRFEPLAILLRQPTAFIDLDAMPNATQSPLGANPSSAGQWPAEIAIQQGLIHISSASRHVDALIGDVEGTADYSGLSSPISANLRATWRDEPLTINLRVDQPAQGSNGADTTVSLTLTTNTARLRFDGDIFNNATLGGSLSATIPASSPLKRLLSLDEDTFVPLQDVAFSGELAARQDSVQLTQMRLSIGQQKFEGALTLQPTPRGATISGTLAAETLNLDDFLAHFPPLFDAKGAWSDAPFHIPRFPDLTVDLRLSAAQVEWRGHRFDDAAMALIGGDGQLTASVLEASAYKGTLKGDLNLRRETSGLALHASADLANVDVGAMLAGFGLSAISGQGSGEFDVGGTGASPAALVRGLEGNALVKLAGGEIEGLSFEEALRRSLRRSIDPANDMRMGRTVFTDASASLRIAHGQARILAAALNGPGVNVGVHGDLDLMARQIDAKAVAIQTDSAGAPTADGPRLTFDLSGPWLAPAVSPGG